MIWRNPVAWLGLATLLIPLAIHLLVRHRAEPRPFPSLRFVQPTRLASVRRKLISDWPLLLIRLALLALAVAALADPLWQSAARQAEWSQRQARAIVVDTTPSVAGTNAAGAANANANASAADASGTTGETGGSTDGQPDAVRSLVQREAANAFRAETFAANDVAEGIRRAANWLRTAPPARRELVVISDFQLGALDATMLRDLPAHVGLRLVRTSAVPVSRTVDGQPRTQRVAASGGLNAGADAGAFALRSPRVTIDSSETAITWVDAASGPPVAIDTIEEQAGNDGIGVILLRPFDVTLRGSGADRPFLQAAAEAVLAQGVPVAAGVTGVRKSATIVVAGETAADDSATSLRHAGLLATSWQTDVVRAIATDTALVRAAGRAMTATIAPVSPTAAPAASGAASSVPSASTAAAPAARASATTAAVTTSEPWTVLIRDAGGRPAILAAADGGHANARMVVWSRVSAADETTALLIRATLRALAGSDTFAEAEVIAIPDSTLAQWQRPASDPPASERRHVDSNDRRWLWGAVLVLLVVEQILRRRGRHGEAQPDRADRKVFEHAA